MGHYASPAEVDAHLGAMFRAADGDPGAGVRMRESGINLRMVLTDPDTELWVLMREPAVVTVLGRCAETPDVTLAMRADTAHRFWSGRFPMAVGLATGEVRVRGTVGLIVRLAPLTRPLIPLYRGLVAGGPGRAADGHH